MKKLIKIIISLCFLNSFVYAVEFNYYTNYLSNISNYLSSAQKAYTDNKLAKKHLDFYYDDRYKYSDVFFVGRISSYKLYHHIYDGYTSMNAISTTREYTASYRQLLKDFTSKDFFYGKTMLKNCDFSDIDEEEHSLYFRISCDFYESQTTTEITANEIKEIENPLQPTKIFPLDFDTKKSLYDLTAQARKDRFCKMKFGVNFKYDGITRIMPFYANLRFLNTKNIAIIDLDKRTPFLNLLKSQKFVFGAGTIFVFLKNFFSSGDANYSDYPVKQLDQVCIIGCINNNNNQVETLTIPFFADKVTNTLNDDALACCSNVSMRVYDRENNVVDESISIALKKDEQELIQAEYEKSIKEYYEKANQEYYTQAIQEFYNPELDDLYKTYVDESLYNQIVSNYNAKVFETEKNNLLDMLNKGAFNELSLDYYKKFLDDETIDYYRKQSVAIDKNLDNLLNGKDNGFKADENANSNTAIGVPPIDNNLTNDKTPPPPPLPPTNDKDGGFKVDNTANKGGVVGGGIGAGSVGGSLVNGGVVGGNVGSNTNANTAEKDLTKDNAQDNLKDKTQENSKADDITISKDSTTSVDKTQTGSKVDVNVKTDVNVDVKASVSLADIPFESEDIDFELDDIDKKLSILDSVNFFRNDFIESVKDFLNKFNDVINKLKETKNYFENLKNPKLVNPLYKNTCPFNDKMEFYGISVPISFDLCKLVSIVYPATFSIFYILFFYMFFLISLKFARILGAFKLKLK